MIVRSLFATGLCATVFAVAAPAAVQQLTQKDADAMQQKIAAIVTHGDAVLPAGVRRAPLRTWFTEREVNAYLKFNAIDQTPAGVREPYVFIVGADRVSGRAVVDLDAVRKSKPRGLFDPMNLLMGAVEVRVAGVLHTAQGKGTFQLESASAAGIPLPKSLLQDLLAYYTKTPQTPQGLDLDKPFALPHNILSVDIQTKGSAVVIQ